MSRGQRLLLVLAVAAVAAVGFAIASPGGGGDDDDSERAGQTTAAGTADTRETPAPPPPKPSVERIRIRRGAVVGGPKRLTVKRGDTVRIVVQADAPDEIHLHGYDITKNARPGGPARFEFDARIEGEFEMESHVAEDAGRDPLVARVVVEPA